MSASSHAGLKFAKPRPRVLDKADHSRERERKSKAEDVKVRTRSDGRCEVITRVMAWTLTSWTLERCRRRAIGEPHHLIFGSGQRNVGRSILAAHKIATCRQCHTDIHGHVLEPSSQDAATVTFMRRR